MIVSNKKNIETTGIFLMFFIPLILIVILCHFMIFRKIDGMIIIFSLLLIVILTLIYRLQYKEFENSGFVITIKKRHPLLGKGFVFPMLEFPVDLLKEFEMKEHSIYFKIATADIQSDKIHKFKIALNGFTDNQCNEILRSLTDGEF